MDWKIWNYRGRKVAFAHFVICCLAALSYGWILWRFHNVGGGNAFALSVICASLIFACFFGYRAFFFSNDWFRAEEARRADWWDKHQRLRFTYSATGSVVYFLVIAYLLWKTFWK
jgi:hypothetical protein